MENNGGIGWRRTSRETSPDRARVSSTFAQQKERGRTVVAAGRKVQVVYYLSRNGQLEHPHFMEILHLPTTQHPRLRDVLDRLTVLRGRGMPSLFSWSCKRSYKNGYVWNDLSENDMIYPAEGAEYILKGSEIIHGCGPPNLEKFQHLQLSKQSRPPPGAENIEAGEEEEEVEEEREMEMKSFANGRMGIQPYNRCPRVVATDAKIVKELSKTHNSRQTEISLDDSSPPSSSSSDKGPAASTVTSFRFEDGDPATEPGLTRNNVLLQLISCGSAAVRGSGLVKSAAAISCDGRKRCSAAEKQRVTDNHNPWRGRTRMPQLEEKEYFSGSIVEAMTESCRAHEAEPSLKKSSSYNEERGAKLALEEDEGEGIGVKGKCIPGKKRSSVKQGEQEQEQSRK